MCQDNSKCETLAVKDYQNNSPLELLMKQIPTEIFGLFGKAMKLMADLELRRYVRVDLKKSSLWKRAVFTEKKHNFPKLSAKNSPCVWLLLTLPPPKKNVRSSSGTTQGINNRTQQQQIRQMMYYNS